MQKDQMEALASMIVFGNQSVDLGDLLATVERHLELNDPFTRRDWEEIAGLLEDLSWLTPFLGDAMIPDTLMSIRTSFMMQMLRLQAEGRIGA